MGTNYYYYDLNKERIHIGKRSAAGIYCWDCNISLYKDRKGPHYSKEIFDKCPLCGKKSNKKDTLAVMRELFGDETKSNKSGISSCSSFSWVIIPYKFKKLKNITIESEYNEKYTIEQFYELLEECPIRYYDMIGVEFS